jgi:hypothetical protein
MSAETIEYRALIVIPVGAIEDDVAWMDLNLGENTVGSNFGSSPGLAPGEEQPVATHQYVSLTLHTAGATVVTQYFQGGLPQGWDEMDKAARLAAAAAAEDAAMASTGKLLVLRDVNVGFSPWPQFERIDTSGLNHPNAGQPLAAVVPPEE